MAIRIEAHQNRYIGLSTDAKPTSGVAPGSTFFETDTKNLKVFDGTSWDSKESLAVDLTQSLLADILFAIQQQNELLAEVIEKL